MYITTQKLSLNLQIVKYLLFGLFIPLIHQHQVFFFPKVILTSKLVFFPLAGMR